MANDITAALRECQEYAQMGYDVAMDSWNKLHTALLEEEEKINAADRQQRQIKRLENAEVLERQKRNLSAFKRMDKELKRDLDNLHKQQAEFSVLVFGRTMVGKSTLMEILTHGDGTSIGNGSQRTTLDVRDYHWQGMKITDVPGIASFDGEDDDRLALEAAKAADLILFLISDDGVQQEEAKNLAELRRLGKPVLGIINVKLGITSQVRAVDLKRLQKKMSETERIEAICNQFRQFSGSYQQDWGDLTFVPTHLKAAYIGQDTNNELWELSNFAAVEQYILSKVQQDGCFLRIKTFMDRAVVPLQKRMEMLFDNSGENIMAAFEYRRKWHDLDEWREEFFAESQEKYDELCERLRRQLENGIRDFAECNYENSNAGKAWQDYLQNELRLDRACENFLQERREKFRRKQRELYDSLKTELDFFSIGGNFGRISMEDITDTQFWGSLGAAGAAAFLGLGPIGAIGLGALNFLFSDSKSEKIRKAKGKLRAQLKDATKPYLDGLLTNVLENMNEKILGQGIGGLRDTLVTMDELLFALAGKEAANGKRLNEMLGGLNRRMWFKADKYLHYEGEKINVNYIIRLPGEMLYAYAQETPAEKYLEGMTSLLGEKVIWDENFVHFSEKLPLLLGEWSYQDFEYDECGKVDCIFLYEKSRLDLLMNSKVRLEYQCWCLPIVEY